MMTMEARPANARPRPQESTRSKERCQPRRPVPREREDDSLELGSEGINIHVASPKGHYKNGAPGGPPHKRQIENSSVSAHQNTPVVTSMAGSCVGFYQRSPGVKTGKSFA